MAAASSLPSPGSKTCIAALCCHFASSIGMATGVLCKYFGRKNETLPQLTISCGLSENVQICSRNKQHHCCLCVCVCVCVCLCVFFVFVFVFILWLQCPSPVMTLRQGLGQGEIPSIPFLETGDELLVSQMIPRQTFLLNQIFVASIFPLLIKLSLHTIE